MHYDALKGDHRLPHDPFMSVVVPRPIGGISTLGASGVGNLAPYGFFNAVCARPPVVMFSDNAHKHSRRNAEEPVSSWSILCPTSWPGR